MGGLLGRGVRRWAFDAGFEIRDSSSACDRESRVSEQELEALGSALCMNPLPSG